MSVGGMLEAWHGLALDLVEFYTGTAGALLEGRRLTYGEFEELEPATERLLNFSEAIRVEAEGELSPGGEQREQVHEPPGGAGEARYDRVCELLLAAATVDAVLASDLARLDPDAGRSSPHAEVPRVAEIFGSWAEAARERRAAPMLFRLGQEAIAQADALYRAPPPIAGGAPLPRDYEALIGDTHDAVVDLVQLAEAPAGVFFEGFTKAATAGIGDALDHVQIMDVVRHLPTRVEPLARGAAKFLREHVKKIVALAVEDSVLDHACDLLAKRMSVRRLLELVSASDAAIERSSTWIERAPNLGQEATDGLRADLEYLRMRYREHMKWLRKSAQVLRFSAKPLALVAVHGLGALGWLIMPGVSMLGGGYVAYSLTDRLDARSLAFADRITGVTRLVEERLAH
jgi:hypothetical protein